MRKTAHVGHRARNAAPIPPQYLPLLALVAVLIGMQVATQIFAWKFAWHESLGEAISGHLYAPWSILRWAAAWHDHFPEHFSRAATMGGIAALVVMFAPLAIIGHLRSRVSDILHGSARWAKRKDIKAAGFAGKNALIKILGKGELTVKVDVVANAFSESAKAKIEALGGTTTIAK